MISLKTYQTRVLHSLRDFFRQSSKDGRPEEAFRAVPARNAMLPAPSCPPSRLAIARSATAEALAKAALTRRNLVKAVPLHSGQILSRPNTHRPTADMTAIGNDGEQRIPLQ